ncbi:MAG TPA: hypothetical protein VEM93_01420 [Actinomycetota bacterium]|nr:hypothetical protein [Actinomycetota bacterium]
MAARPTEEPLFFNGIDGLSGQYLLPPLGPRALSKVAQGEPFDAQERAELQARFRASSEKFLGAIEGVDVTDVADSGWGVVFAHDGDPMVHEALQPLLDHRRAQVAAGSHPNRYREFSGADGYRPGESSAAFLARHGTGPVDAADPDKVPYYLLLVGDPESIPYRFQYQLDVTYAVGRVSFEMAEEYARYATSVIQAEAGTRLDRRAVFFGMRNEDDRATQMSADLLVEPLARELGSRFGDRGWTVETRIGEGQTSKADVSSVLTDGSPTVFFSASHGMGFPNGDPRQLPAQGALLCQDWPGPLEWRQGIPPEFYFAGEDVGGHARLSGMIAFVFACYGAGTPKQDDFARQALNAPADIAPASFVASLPRALLSHPNGGALAAVGHVERAWSYSFAWPRLEEQIGTFTSAMSALFKGNPLGAALEYFNDRYAALTVELESVKETIEFGGTPDDLGVAGLWTARNDARNYVIIGDPAVRITW